MTSKDIATIPPVDTAGEMKRAAELLTRFRKALADDERPLGPEWQLWIANSLKDGLLAQQA
jgi:hypothetical protein